jgi:endogenous inhibitor of DNA gyrase (YacG/DUF329 family)
MAPRWVVNCPECREEFTHTDIEAMKSGAGSRDLFASPPKPTIAEGGTQLICPKCNKTSAYQISDLRFRAN